MTDILHKPDYSESNAFSASRLLVISYHFPPDPAVGGIRWAELGRLAVERGWGVDVIAATDAPTTTLELVEPDIRVLRVSARVPRWISVGSELATRVARGTRSRMPYAPTRPQLDGSRAPSVQWATPRDVCWRLHTPHGWLRMYRVLKEVAFERAWSLAAVRAGASLFRGGVHRAIITSGPPHFTHDAGRKLAQRCRVPFVMDMRDPWSGAPWIPLDRASPIAWHIARTFESAAVDRAALILANTSRAREYLVARYPARRGDIVTVTNGFGEDPLPAGNPLDRFLIAHLGTLYLDRTPEPVLRAAAKLIGELQLSPSQFGLSFIGGEEGGGPSVAAMAEAAGIAEYVETGPSVARSLALERMASAAMLLLLVGAHPSAIPAKVFEYMRFSSWLLALAAPESATADLLRGTGADVVVPTDEAAIVQILRARYMEFSRGLRPKPLATDIRFSRRYQADILFKRLEESVPGLLL